MRRLVLVCMALVICLVQAVQAQIGVGGGPIIRREVHEDQGDYRPAVNLFAGRDDRDPYWGYLAVSKELLMAPNRGVAEAEFVLVTPDGKPVVEARWTEDHLAPYSEWHEMRYANGRWIMIYDLEGCRSGTRTIFFGGKIKGGKRSYTKLNILVEITKGGKRKDKRQADAFQFMIYVLPNAPRRVDSMTLINAQEQMGAGGRPLIGPEIEEAPENGGNNGGGETNGNASGAITIVFQGFSSWVRVEWDDGEVSYLFVDGTASLPVRGKSFDLYIVATSGQRQSGQRVKYNGQIASFPATVAGVSVTRTAR